MYTETTIKSGKLHNLRASLDYDTDETQTYPVLLFTPNMGDTNTHYHIALNAAESRRLAGFLVATDPSFSEALDNLREAQGLLDIIMGEEDFDYVSGAIEQAVSAMKAVLKRAK